MDELNELRDGMVLAEDVYNASGTLLLARGQRVRGEHVPELLDVRTVLE